MLLLISQSCSKRSRLSAVYAKLWRRPPGHPVTRPEHVFLMVWTSANGCVERNGQVERTRASIIIIPGNIVPCPGLSGTAPSWTMRRPRPPLTALTYRVPASGLAFWEQRQRDKID